jgi:hypothetical protein
MRLRREVIGRRVGEQTRTEEPYPVRMFCAGPTHLRVRVRFHTSVAASVSFHKRKTENHTMGLRGCGCLCFCGPWMELSSGDDL